VTGPGTGKENAVSRNVQHNPDRSRYELVVNGETVGIADYRQQGGTWVFPHTEIIRTHRGRGLGAELVRGALDDVRRSGGKVVPQCWYVAEFIDDNPTYQDMLSRPA
jgi:predicted GNAT family acetyltransferase